MTSREWDIDRRVVFDRDEYTCQHCESAGDEETLRLYPVGTVPTGGPVHESSLVTVCSTCAAVLRDDARPASAADSAASNDADGSATLAAIAPDELFALVHETTRKQGTAVSDAAAFASFATTLPSALAGPDGDGDESTGSGDRAESPESPQSTAPATGDETGDTGSEASVDELSREFVTARRTLLLALSVVDRRLARLDQFESDATESAAAPLLLDFVDTATKLQSELHDLVSLAELVAASIGRCHNCFEPLAVAATPDGPAPSRPCPTCAQSPRDTEAWHHADSNAVDFERLFSATNETLRDAAATTETLTERTTALATELVEK
ncbi:HNH endonuclease [Natrialba asiatica]|uniref:HNH endonuclease n=1 Tax=Natrialba asiatica TaxID=64602 RepID=UPI001F4D33E4|nr:hypothetical protein [Natrialba asiatica]